jgi:hypothetical protein
MKPSEKEVLDTLRKTTLAYLSESDYAEIEKAVEQEGILNLTGTASAIVKSAVQKHGGGSHDQASHGSWAGNGAGGGNDPGGYKAEAIIDENEMMPKMRQTHAMQKLKNKYYQAIEAIKRFQKLLQGCLL